MKGIPKHDVVRLLQAIDGLANDPYPWGSQKLTGREAWRLRVGKYRIVYQIEDEKVTVVVVKIGHRRHVYQ